MHCTTIAFKNEIKGVNFMKNPQQIAEAMCNVGLKKTQIPFGKMLVLGILAGVYIGFGSQLATMVTQDLAGFLGVGVSQFLVGSVFTIGLMLVVLGGAELFTGNNLIIMGCATKTAKVSGLLKNWIVVYIGNFIGSLLLVTIVFAGFYFSTTGTSALGLRALGIANAKVNLNFIAALARGIAANWLVCLAVWLSVSAETTIGKIWGMFFPIMAFVAMGFEHSIANMYFIPMGLYLTSLPDYAAQAASNLTVSGFLFNNLLPVTIGNIIGGAFFVGIVYWYIYLYKPKSGSN